MGAYQEESNSAEGAAYLDNHHVHLIVNDCKGVICYGEIKQRPRALEAAIPRTRYLPSMRKNEN